MDAVIDMNEQIDIDEDISIDEEHAYRQEEIFAMPPKPIIDLESYHEIHRNNVDSGFDDDIRKLIAVTSLTMIYNWTVKTLVKIF